MSNFHELGKDVTPKTEDRWTPVEELRADYVVNDVRVIIANGIVRLVDANTQGVEFGPEYMGENFVPAGHARRIQQSKMDEEGAEEK